MDAAALLCSLPVVYCSCPCCSCGATGTACTLFCINNRIALPAHASFSHTGQLIQDRLLLLLVITFFGMPMSRDLSSCMSFDTASSAAAVMAVQRSSTAMQEKCTCQNTKGLSYTLAGVS
jgi:hypothetical protein